MKRAVFSAIVALLAFAAAQTAQAATWYWTGGGGDLNWFTAANWNSAADGTGDAAETLASGDSFVFGAVAPAGDVDYNPSSGDFAVASITFAEELQGPVTVRGGTIASLGSVVNNSSNDHVFENKVVFFGNCKTIRNGTGYVKYPGGAQAYDMDYSTNSQNTFFGKFRFTFSGEITPGGVILKTGTFWEWPNATFYRHNGGIIVESGATGLVANAIIRAENKVLIGKVDGVFMITNNFSYTKAGGYAKFVDQAGTGDVVVRKVSNGSGRHMIPFLTQSEGRTIIGEGGVGNGDYCRVWDNGNTYHIGSYADWDISYYVDRDTSKAKGNAGIYKAGTKSSTAVLIFDTTDYYDRSIGRKITSCSTLLTQTNPQYMRVVVEGIGVFEFANRVNPDNLFAGGLLASNSARVVVNSGSKPGAGNVTLRDTSTLELKNDASVGGAVDAGIRTTLLLPETGTATVGGQLWMRNSSKMKFRIDGSNNAQIVLSGSSKIEKAVEISFTVDSVPSFGRSYTLTQGAEFTDAILDSTTESYFKLAAGTRGTLSVVGGELVYNAPKYFYIKVADGAARNLEIPWQWIIDNNTASLADSDAAVKAALLVNGANGLPVWQSYCLGLDPQAAGSVVLCSPAAEQPSQAGKFKIDANIAVPSGLSGVSVKAHVDRKTAGGDWTLDETGTAVQPGGRAVFEVSADGAAASFFA